MKTKVFCIGLNKTGTTTLEKCGELLGLECASCNRSHLEDVTHQRGLQNIVNTVNEFDLFQDWPYPLIYKELDQLFPGSKFILTTRINEIAWLDSLKRHSWRTHPTQHCRKLAYGFDYPFGFEKEHLQFYKSHNEAVRNYFSNREDDFIELCWETGSGWGELCEFLGMEVPEIPFPHMRKGNEQPIPVSYAVSNFGRICLQRMRQIL